MRRSPPIFLSGIIALASLVSSQRPRLNPYVEDVYREGNDILWCCLSAEEMRKCEEFAAATQKDHDMDERIFGSYFRKIKCKRYNTKNECMKVLDENDVFEANVMVVDSGDVFTGGRYHSLVPILKEIYADGHDWYHSVAVIKKGSLPDVQFLHDLKGKQACFAEVGSLAGWTIPIFRLMESKVMEIKDCNNHVKSAIDFFGTSCAVNSLQDRYNPLGDNSHKFCELCGSDVPGIRCTNRDPYAGVGGAFRCLQDKGEIAFLNELTVFDNAENQDDFELLCITGDDYLYDDGREPPQYGSQRSGVRPVQLLRRPVSEYAECSWGVAPGNALVVSSAMELEQRAAIQQFMRAAAERYAGLRLISNLKDGENATTANDNPLFQYNDDYENEIPTDNEEEEEVDPRKFRLFVSAPKYGTVKNLLFSDGTVRLVDIKLSDQSYKSFLSRTYGNSLTTPEQAINGIRQCPIGQMTLCVTSEPELAKCVQMRTALKAQLLEPTMNCKKARTDLACMRLIRSGEADVTVLDAGDVYRAGYLFGLAPVMAEVYNLGTPHYYAVAVVHIRDNSSELIYLKKKNTCHSGIGHAAGWIVPMAWLLSNERIRDYGCDSVRAASEYFSKACAPGAMYSQFQTRLQDNYWEYKHMCDLCHGSAGSYCERNHMEDYYGHTGAFRCLVEGGGHVAFVKHTTVMENTDGKRKEWWARNQLTTDYQLLCRDGTRAPAREYKRCYMGKVKSNAIVTNRDFGDQRIDTYINLFKYAQQFYGKKTPDEFSFSMFYSNPPYADLIFQDATQQLVVLPKSQRHYRAYLDKDFLTAYSMVECKSAAAGQFVNVGLLIAVLISYFCRF